MMQNGWKTDGRQRGMQNAGIWRRIMNGYIENPWTKLSFIHLLMSLGHLYSARLQQEAWWMKRRLWKRDDAIGMKNGCQRGTLNERKNTSRLDGRKRYLFIRCRPVRTKACAWETGTSGVFLHFARVVKSAASRENRASFRCDIVVVQWNSSRLFANDFFLASWKSWFLFKPAKLRVLSIWFSFLRCQSLGCFKPRNVVLLVWFRSRAIKVLLASSRGSARRD